VLYRIEPEDERSDARVFSEMEIPKGGDLTKIRFSLRSFFLVFLFVAAALGLLISVGPILLTYYVYGEGPIWSRSKWPYELRTLIESLPDSAEPDIDDIDVYCFENFINEGYVWRFTLRNDAYASLTQDFDTIQVAKPDPSDEFWKPPPKWWDPNPNADAEFLAWPDARLGTDLVTMYDKQNEVLYGWSYIEF
jgi:hypothetical protein